MSSPHHKLFRIIIVVMVIIMTMTISILILIIIITSAIAPMVIDYDPVVGLQCVSDCLRLTDAMGLSVVEVRDVADVRSYKPICNRVYL